MIEVFGPLKGLLKLGSIASTKIDNAVFQLHYKVTAPILIVFSLLVTSKQHIGDPIECISKDDIPEKVLNTYCWIHATFSVENAWEKEIGKEIAYPGVDKYKEGDSRVFHAYYQWVCFVLFLQALLFCIPRYFWKCMEKGKIKSLVMDLHNPVLDMEAKSSKINTLVDYMVRNLNNNDNYSTLYMMSEAFNVINVIGQMYLMDTFLGGEFSSYGAQVIKFTEWDFSLRYDPMIRVFPRLAKCTFHRYGSSGDVQRHDAMCILPINIVNEKIYVFIWFWFVGLAVVSCIALAYRVATFFCYDLRVRLLRFRGSLVREEPLEVVARKTKVGDWFVLYLLSKNMHSLHFRDFMVEFARRLDGKGHHNDISEA
ncbi:innexin inx2-like [Uloborus diversus]|uniref:innexin inx2-like n=1 Tax=Uloborus diversus TaxID=327109 RepID=UPI00240999C2|nr:innexin inx2-like [Uloborus diversus]